MKPTTTTLPTTTSSMNTNALILKGSMMHLTTTKPNLNPLAVPANLSVIKEIIDTKLLSSLTTTFLVDTNYKMLETEANNWYALTNREYYRVANMTIKTIKSELTNTYYQSLFNSHLDEMIQLSSDLLDNPLVSYRQNKIIADSAILFKALVKQIPEYILEGTVEDFKAWNTQDKGQYQVNQTTASNYYTYAKLLGELNLLQQENITDEDIKAIISQLTSISKEKKLFVKQQMSIKGDAIRGQIVFELLRSLDINLIRLEKTKGHKTYSTINETNKLFFNTKLFQLMEFTTRAYKLNVWSSAKTDYTQQDYYTKNAFKDLRTAKDSMLMNNIYLGKIDSRSKAAIKLLNNQTLCYHKDIISPEIIQELIDEDSQIKGLKGEVNRLKRIERRQYLQNVLFVKYSVLLEIGDLYTDTRLDAVSGRMHGGLMQGSKTERTCKVLSTPIALTPNARQHLLNWAEKELDLSKASHLAKYMRIQEESPDSSVELIEIDATNQVFQLMGILLNDEKLLSYGGGIFNDGTLIDAYTALGTYLQTKLTDIVKERLGKKAKKALKKTSFTALFTRDAMKPLVMPLVYGKGLKASLYGTTEQQDSVYGFSAVKSSAEIYKVHNQLQNLSDTLDTDNSEDLKNLPLYWGLQGFAWDMISKEELEIIYTSAIETLFPKLLEAMKLLQKAFITSTSSMETVAYNILGVSGLLQRKNKLSPEQQFLNSLAVQAGNEPTYTLEKLIVLPVNNKFTSIHYTPKYAINNPASTIVTPSLITNMDSTLVRYVALTSMLNGNLFQVYDAFYVSPADIDEVVSKYKQGLRLLSKANILENFVTQLGGNRVIIKSLELLKGKLNNNRIRKFTSVIGY